MLLRTVLWLGLTATVTNSYADVLWGVNGHPLAAYPGISVAEQFDYLTDLSIKSYRVDISDVGRAEELANLVQEGKARGIEILPVLTPNNIDLDKDTAESLYSKAYAFAEALGSKLGTEIRVWELGNEMENYAIIQPCEMRDDGTKYPCEWGPAGGVAALEYFGPRWAKVSAILKGLSEGLDAVDPDLRKAIGTAGWGHLGAFERMKSDEIDWDISVWHTYGEDPEWAFETLARFEKPIWVTEFNHPLGSQPGDGQQAEGLASAMARLRELAATYDVEAAHIYELMDEAYWAPDFEAFMGLVRMVPTNEGSWRAGEPKPAYFAVRDLIRGPSAFVFPRRDCQLPQAAGTTTSPAERVHYAFCLILGRGGDGDGVASWAAEVENDTFAVSEMLLGMLNSSEFRQRYRAFGLTDEDYVRFLYLLLLDREADQQGLKSYSQDLAAGSMNRPDLAAAIINSGEFADAHPVLSRMAMSDKDL